MERLVVSVTDEVRGVDTYETVDHFNNVVLPNLETRLRRMLEDGAIQTLYVEDEGDCEPGIRRGRDHQGRVVVDYSWRTQSIKSGYNDHLLNPGSGI